MTDLNNFSVPLIRYRLGDLAKGISKEKCECGRSSPRLGSIVGRTQALVLVSGGKWLPGTFFAHFFKEYESLVSQFQVVQHFPDGFTLKILKGPHWSMPAWRSCVEDLQRYAGEEVSIDYEFVSQIPLLRTGKRTPVVSSLRIDFQEIETEQG